MRSDPSIPLPPKMPRVGLVSDGVVIIFIKPLPCCANPFFQRGLRQPVKFLFHFFYTKCFLERTIGTARVANERSLIARYFLNELRKIHHRNADAARDVQWFYFV